MSERAIKFRAWHIATKRMYEVIGIDFAQRILECPCKDGCETGIDEFFFDEVDLHQLIGLVDHHDREIYEGDIVEYIDNTSRGLVKKIVVIHDIRHLPDFGCSKWEEIIGNIYANPELIPQEVRA